MKRLRLFDFEHLHVLADGARWIWEAADEKFINTKGALIFSCFSNDIWRIKRDMQTEEKRDRLFSQWSETLLHHGWIGNRDILHNAQEEAGSGHASEVLQKLYKFFLNMPNI